MAASPSPRLGDAGSLARYTPLRKLGSGSVGTVYLARDEVTGQTVALKLLRPDRVSPAALARLQEEFRAIASLRHERIAQAYDFGYTEDGKLPYYTRQHIPGAALAAGPPGAEPPRAFLQPVLDLLDALEYLHAHGVLHLDIHPGNLIVPADGAGGAVLIDFGLVGSLAGSTAVTGWGAWSPLPLELRPGGKPGPTTDVFLAGRLLHYRLTGRVAGEPSLPSEIPGWGPRVTAQLERILLKALAEDPRSRFASAAELRRELEHAISPPGAPPRGAPAGSSEPREVLVGRTGELRRIETVLTDALEGRGGVVCLVGPAGAGKSRLLREARLRAQLRGLEVVEVAFVRGRGPGATFREQAQAYARGRRAAFAWLEPLREEHGGGPQERAARAVQSYFGDDERPLVFCIDDLEHADEAGRIFLEALAAELLRRQEESAGGRGLGLLVTAAKRPEERALRRSSRSVGPLAAREARDLLRATLEPSIAPPRLARRVLAEARGSPLRIRQLAHALREAWPTASRLPGDASLPRWEPDRTSAGQAAAPGGSLDAAGARIVETLSAAGRGLQADEIAAAAELDAGLVRRTLRALERAERVAVQRRGPGRIFVLLVGGAAETVAGSPTRREVHARLARHLAALPRPGLETRAHLARHTLASGDARRGRALALAASRDLTAAGFLDAALRLLEDVDQDAFPLAERLEIAEEISSIHAATGAHAAGVDCLAAYHRGDLGALPRGAAVRVGRRLGVHLHRSGRAAEALRVFQEAQERGDPRRDLEDLVFIDSEIAELCTLQGSYERAEEACRRGLARLEDGAIAVDFRSRMEVVLRGSLGHLELRRGRLEDARLELRRAASLARRHAPRAVRAVILGNLGIAENQLNRFQGAARCFREAERLLGAAGERRAVMSIACNLAVIAAKQGRGDDARAHVERARTMLRSYPGDRHAFLVGHSAGLVHELLGESAAAVSCLESALPTGRKIGDVHLSGFGEVTLAEAHLCCGRYARALEVLRAASAREARGDGGGRRGGGGSGALLGRMAHARQALLEGLLGRERPARRSLRVLDELPPTDFELPEAWNALFAGAAHVALRSAAPDLDRAQRTFRRIGVPAGERLCRLVKLLGLLARGELEAARAMAAELAPAPPVGHRLADALLPLALAELALRQGRADEARLHCTEASGAMVGADFLELDLWLEHLKARLLRARGDLTAARGHFQRSAHTRDLIAELAPRTARGGLARHGRFGVLAGLGTALERAPRLAFSTRAAREAAAFEGIVGRSAVMRDVFRHIDLLRDQELPVLIRGETGTGKDLVAAAIHRTGVRSRGPFLALHCASLPDELLEAELFGHEAGAFTGAEEARPGILESLAGGTLFLDEVGDLSAAAQTKLLRAIESGAVRRLGSHEPRLVDVRFIASSRADLRAGAGGVGGAFRLDLYYRLAAVELVLPPLRERRDDIPLLAQHLLERHGRRLDRTPPALSPAAAEALAAHDWPGNVRELEVILLRACFAAPRLERIEAAAIEPLLAPRPSGPLFKDELLEGRDLEELKAELERAYLARLFREVGGDRRRMMEKLGVKQSQLYAWLRKLGLDVRSLRREL